MTTPSTHTHKWVTRRVDGHLSSNDHKVLHFTFRGCQADLELEPLEEATAASPTTAPRWGRGSLGTGLGDGAG